MIRVLLGRPLEGVERQQHLAPASAFDLHPIVSAYVLQPAFEQGAHGIRAYARDENESRTSLLGWRQPSTYDQSQEFRKKNKGRRKARCQGRRYIFGD